MKEIDRHKSDGNGRRAKRARQASSMFSKALEEGSNGGLLGIGGLTWEFGSGHMAKHDHLDLSQGDDRIVAEALFVSRQTRDQVVLLSGDTIVRLKAKLIGLQTRDLPPHWQLMAEPNESEKKLAALEQRVRALENVAPQLLVRMCGQEDAKAGDTMEVSARRCRPLTDAEVDGLVECAIARFPMAATPVTEVSLAIRARAERETGRIVHPLQGEFEAYKNIHYPRWTSEVRKWINEYCRRRTHALSVCEAHVSMENIGSVPADGLILEYRATRGALLVPPCDKDASALLASPPFPKPPKVPQPTFYSGPPRFAPFDPFPAPEPSRIGRNPYAFYWQSEPCTVSERHVFECKEFRHGSIEQFAFRFILPETPDPGNMVLLFHATARNLPQPWEGRIAVRYVMDSYDPMSELRARIYSSGRRKKRPITLRLAREELAISGDDDKNG